jgi:hypothetical protein
MVMMLKVLPLTALILGLSSGAALADHRHDQRGPDHRATTVVRDHRGGGNVVVRDHNTYNTYRGGYNRAGYDRGRVIVRSEPRRYNNNNYYNHNSYNHVVRRPIFVSRPVIGHRYYNYYQRPSLIIENYSAMPGYYWVRGAWTWDGYEWIWQPGHYEPDPNYIDQGYGYDGY